MEALQQTPPRPATALFREIHKNAWLKRLPPLAGDAAKLLAVGQKKNNPERWWIVFCVHDDASAYLEAYNDAAHATAHVPKWRAALGNTLHVSGSIRPLGRGEYEFVVALREEAVRLVAPSREVMQDWVDTLRNKLREMKILSPRENVYSKPPEQIKPRAPTRDPNSPLPAPPPGPIARVPGIEEPPRVADVIGEAINPATNESDIVAVDNTVNETVVIPPGSGEVSGIHLHRNQVNEPVRISSGKKSLIQLTSTDSNGGQSSSRGSDTVQVTANLDASRLHVQHDDSNAWLDENEHVHSNNVSIVNSDVLALEVSAVDESLPSVSDDAAQSFNVVVNVNATTKQNEASGNLALETCANDQFIMPSNMDEFLTSQLLNSSALQDDSWVSEEASGSSASGSNGYYKKKKKSNTAQVSGMNVCLVNSVLMERYLDSDGFDDENEGGEDTKGLVEVIPGEVVKAKYSQVNLKEKKVNKEHRQLKSDRSKTEQSSSNQTKSNAATEKGRAKESEGSSSKSKTKPPKPAILPRTVMNVNCEDVEAVEASKTILKPAVIERKKILLNRTSSVPDAVGTEELLQSYRGQMVEESGPNQEKPSSNVTIITLSEPHSAIPLMDKNVFNFERQPSNSNSCFEPGHGRSVSDTKSEDLSSEEISFQDDLNLLKSRLFPGNSAKKNAEKLDYETCFSIPSKKISVAKDPKVVVRKVEDDAPITVSNSASYVNVTTGNSESNVFVTSNSVNIDDNSIGDDVIVLRSAPGRKFEAISNVSMSVGTGYGHIRHSTTVESKPDTNSCDLNQNISNLSVKSHSVDRNNEVFDDNTVRNGAIIDLNAPGSSHTSPETVEALHLIDFIKLNDDSKSRRKSESQISTVKICEPSKINVVSQKNDLYESVFTPFSVTAKDESGRQVKVTSSKINVTHVESIGDNSQAVAAVNEIVSVNNGIVTPKVGDNASRTENGDYEYLSWVRTDGVPPRAKQITNRSDSNRVAPNAKPAVKNADGQKTNIFTRGLTELSFVSRFKNNFIIGSPSSTNRNVTSQFYCDTEQGPSSSAAASNINNNNSSSVAAPPKAGLSMEKKNGVFGGRFNAIFGRLHQDGVSKNSQLTNLRVENSTLRRNWSEHNDRTAPAPILRTKPIRPRPPLLEGQTSQASANQNTEQDRDGEVRQMRRRSSSLSSARCSVDEGVNNTNGSATDTPLSPSSLNTISGVLTGDSTANHASQPAQRPLSLRSQQVCRLRREMSHSAGVRLRLRARDCPGEAVALVDAYGAVWVAGWKQRSHPLLYNALHIGDRLAAVGGMPVSCARQARKALGDTANGAQFVELIIKRLPHGRVYALRKDADIQDLGLILDSATVVGIIPNSPASKSMVPAGGTLTEVNGRPLNLLLKKGDSQVKDRLNSIGKDVSVLLQPTEFVSLLRTALKAVRGHKDYIVQ